MSDSYFDRGGHPDLLAALAPGGFANSLVEFGRSGQYCLDLQIRRNPKDRVSWASLYVGTTKVLDLALRGRSGKMWLEVPDVAKIAHPDWRASWGRAGDPARLAQAWPVVESYLEDAIVGVGDRFGKEGRIQASLSLYPATDMVVIDRETVVGYTDMPARQRVIKRYLDPLMAAVEGYSKERWWKPKAPGNECDGLAIATTGELLAIEVKPPGVGGIVWAPLQAIHYANLLQHWADEHADAPPGQAPADILLGMYEQRRALGLIREPAAPPALTVPIMVRPVVAIGGKLSAESHRRLKLVAQCLRDAGYDVEYRQVNLVGRMDPLDLS